MPGEVRGGLPDDLDEFTHVDVVRHQELGLVQDGKLLFSFIPLNDHLQDTQTFQKKQYRQERIQWKFTNSHSDAWWRERSWTRRGDWAVADWILKRHRFLTVETVVRPVSILNCELVTGRGSHTYQMRVERGEDPIMCIKPALQMHTHCTIQTIILL